MLWPGIFSDHPFYWYFIFLIDKLIFLRRAINNEIWWGQAGLEETSQIIQLILDMQWCWSFWLMWSMSAGIGDQWGISHGPILPVSVLIKAHGCQLHVVELLRDQQFSLMGQRLQLASLGVTCTGCNTCDTTSFLWRHFPANMSRRTDRWSGIMLETEC